MKKPKRPRLVSFEEKYGFSFIKALIFNFLCLSTTIGITQQLKVDSIAGFFIFMALYTLLEVLTVNLMKKYLMTLVIKSLGLLIVLIYVVLIYFSVYVVPDIRFLTLLGFILFVTVFLVLRLLMMYYYEKYIESKREQL